MRSFNSGLAVMSLLNLMKFSRRPLPPLTDEQRARQAHADEIAAHNAAVDARKAAKKAAKKARKESK